jgi:2'-5' RNA ligase
LRAWIRTLVTDVRLFFAIELPPNVQRALGQLRPAGDESRDYRWADPASLHVTLAFLGNQPGEKLEVLERIGHEATEQSAPGVLRLGSAGAFGARRAPRVLWVDLAGDLEALTRLQARLDSGLRRAGFELEDRPFRPHITLARRRETASGGPPAGWPPRVASTSFSLHQLTLFQSRLSPRGPTYVPVFAFPLGGAIVAANKQRR